MLHPVGFWGAAGGPTVSQSAADVTRERTTTCYAGVQYNSSGIEYANAVSGALSYNVSRGNWLDSGSASDVWAIVTVTGSNTTVQGSGTGSRLNLGTTRNWYVVDTNSGVSFRYADITIDLYDAATGGNLLGSASFTLTANYTTIL